jgi:hypothetical protein
MSRSDGKRSSITAVALNSVVHGHSLGGLRAAPVPQAVLPRGLPLRTGSARRGTPATARHHTGGQRGRGGAREPRAVQGQRRCPSGDQGALRAGKTASRVDADGAGGGASVPSGPGVPSVPIRRRGCGARRNAGTLERRERCRRLRAMTGRAARGGHAARASPRRRASPPKWRDGPVPSRARSAPAEAGVVTRERAGGPGLSGPVG